MEMDKMIQDKLSKNFEWKDAKAFKADLTCAGPEIKTSAPELMFVSIVPTCLGQEEFAVQLILNRFRRTGIRYYAMWYAMHPTGNDPMQKPLSYVPSFALIKKLLGDNQDIELGILLQSTIGHGGYWNSNTECALEGQKLIREDGTVNHRFCPFEKNFTDYITEAVSALAALKPAFMIIDDDLRPYAGFCFCPEHIRRLNEMTGRNFTRETLAEHLKNAPPFDEVAKAFHKLNIESVGVAAKAIREGMDRHDESIRGAYCACYPNVDAAEEILKQTGGEKPLFLRLSNSYYTEKEIKQQADKDLLTAYQAVNFKKRFDIPLIDESDTCPHDRFSKSARTMNLHIVSGILHGCRGGKLWFDSALSNVSDLYEETFARYAGLYRELAEQMKQYTPEGAFTVIPPFEQNPYPAAGKSFVYTADWGCNALGKMGLPVSYADMQTQGIRLLAGTQVDHYTDEELLEMFKGSLLIDGEAAVRLSERGFASKTGVYAVNGTAAANSECVLENNMVCRFNSTDPYSELQVSENAEVLSMLRNQGKDVLPGSVFFKNSDGGRIITAALNIGRTVPMNVLNPSRKFQFTEMLERLGDVPAVLTALQDAKLMCGRLADGRMMWTAVNYSYDPLPLEFSTCRKISKISELMPDGSYRELDFIFEDGKLTIEQKLEPAEFSILILE